MRLSYFITSAFIILGLSACNPVIPNPVDDLGSNMPIPATGSIIAKVDFRNSSNHTHSYKLLNHIVGHLLSQVTFTISGGNMKQAVSQTVLQASWTNPDGTYSPIQATFANVVAGNVSVGMSGLSSDGVEVVTGSSTVKVNRSQTTSVVLNAVFSTGGSTTSTDPNAATP